jgi:putative ABC transport system permease protein
VSDSRWFRLRNVFRPSARAEADDEIAFHIEMRARELVEQGFSAEQAREMARERFGPVRPIETALIDSTQRRRQRADRAEVFMNLKQDLSYAVRSLRKNPAFAAAAIATLALGVSATIAVFTVVNGVLLRPLPYRDQSRIAMIWMTDTNDKGETSDLPLTSGFFADIQREATRFEAMAAFRSWPYSLSTAGSGEVERVAGARVSPTLFRVLGVQPIAGRAFTTEHAVPGAPNVAMISYDLWQRRFGGDRSIVGKQVDLSGKTFTILAVMPAGFTFPRGAELPAGFQFGLRTDVWTPLVFDSTDLRNYGTNNLSAVGKLSGSPLSAQAELAGIMKRFLEANAPRLKLSYRVVSLGDQAGQSVRRGLLILFGAVMCVLLIASANVVGLLVARVTSRQRELAVRAALGAGRGRIARQLVTENLVLAVAGTTLGGVISFWATKVMLALVPGSMPRADDIGLDWRVLLFAALVALLGGVAFGIAAAASVSWSRLAGTLHAGDTRSTGTLSQRYGRRALVAVEVALSLMLLIGAGLLTRTFVELQRVRPGFDANNVLTAGVSLPIAGRFDPLTNGPAWSTKLSAIANQLKAAPGVVSVGAVSSLPLSGAIEGGGIRIVGRPTPPPGQGPHAQYNVVVGDYFGAAGIRVVAGRAFDASDDEAGRRSIIVNNEFARTQFGSAANTVGKEVRATFEFTNNPTPRTIVGVVEDVKQMGLADQVTAQVYVPESQMTYPRLVFVVRTKGDPLAAVPAVRQVVRSVDPGATVYDIRPMEDVVAQSLARQRFSMTLIGTFAALALVLAIVGLYGVLALIVGQRRREIGVRMALGAGQGDVVRMIVGEGARVAGFGVIAGVAGGLGLMRVLGTLLYGVSTTDMLTFAGASVIVAITALAATYVPARRAARVDPKAALVAD